MKRKKIHIWIIVLSSFCILSNILDIDNSNVVYATNNSIKNMDLVADNEFLNMYFDYETTELAIEVKESGDIWYTNPPDREDDSLAKDVNKRRLNSQLSITYYTPEAQKRTMDNFNNSVVDEQFEVIEITNGIKVIYEIGEMKKSYLVPEALTEERFETILSKVTDDDDIRMLKKRYRHIEEEKLKKEEEQELLSKYPILEEGDIYVLRPNLGEYVLEELERIFTDTGYTSQDLESDNSKLNISTEESEEEGFIIPIEYQLDGEQLVVSIPTSEIEYNESYPLTQIRVLEFFGSAGTRDQGYMLVPDGSGALIYLNNGKTQARSYISKSYGKDRSIKEEQLHAKNQTSHLPVFGLKKGESGFLGIIEEGSSLSNVRADIAGKLNSYNTICAEFTTLSNDIVDLHTVSGNNIVMAYQKQMYEGNLKVRYSFLSNDDANYMGMAKCYREYLIERDLLSRLESEGDIPFYIELLGAIDKIKPIMGIPMRGIEPLTTYEQAEKILYELKSLEIPNIKLKYTGWFNGGINHSIPTDINLQSQLGGRRGFKKLIESLDDTNTELFPDVCFTYAYRNKLFDKFSVRRDAARFLDREVAKIYDFNPATAMSNRSKDPYYIINPYSLGNIVDPFLRRYKKLGIKGLSLRYMGSDLNSNFKENRPVDREESMDILVGQLDKIEDDNLKLMINGGNAYAIPYASHILNMPVTSSNYNICDESIPFYQIVIHGYISYAGIPINLSEDYNQLLLKNIETGANPYFIWIYNDNSVLKDSHYNQYYSVNYRNWLDEAARIYRELNCVLGDVQDKEIIAHERLTEDVYKVSFEGGKTIIINYTKSTVHVDGVTVEPENYKVLQGGEDE